MGLIELVHKRNAANKNVNITTIGLPGSGKSYGDIRFLMLLLGIEDKSVLDYVHFEGNSFMKAIKTETDGFETHMLDDAGFTYAGREWWKEKNIDFVKELQVVRMSKKNILMSAPHPRLVDSGLGPITHIMISLDYWHSSIEGKAIYHKHIVEMTEKGVKDYWKYAGKLDFGHLDEKIARAYEKKKRQDLRKKKTKTTYTPRDRVLYNIIEHLNRLSYDDLEELNLNRKGKYKPFNYRTLGDIGHKKKDWISKFIDDMSAVL